MQATPGAAPRRGDELGGVRDVRRRVCLSSLLMGSWIEHLRQQERHTMNDLLLQSRVLAFHQGTTSPATLSGRAGLNITITCRGTHYGNV
ncbi:MAG: hypothetical protein ACLR9W_05420 [Enterobacter hormaechei]